MSTLEEVRAKMARLQKGESEVLYKNGYTSADGTEHVLEDAVEYTTKNGEKGVVVGRYDRKGYREASTLYEDYDVKREKNNTTVYPRGKGVDVRDL